jgi:hypothetical protein
MANVDLHAIVDLADRVAFDMKDAATPDVLAFFSRLEQYPIPGLGDAVVSLKAGWLWFRAGDEAGCESLLAPLHTRDLSSVKYASLLELYLEFYADVAPVTRQLKIIERILELHNSDFFPAAAQLLHYAIVKGLFSLMLGDHEAMLRIVNEAVTRHLAEVEAKEDIFL